MDLDFDETIFAKDLISDFTISKRDREKIRSTKEKFRTADFLYGNCSFLSMHRQRTARVPGIRTVQKSVFPGPLAFSTAQLHLQ